MITAFVSFLLMFALVGVLSFIKSRGNKSDYYLASGSVAPSLVGLSAVATNNSGYMFIGVIGYTYTTGLSAIWLMLGWIFGDYLASTFVHKRLRQATSRSGEVSYAGVLSNWYGSHQPQLQRVIGLLSLLFLLAYASAQLIAGSKALHVLLGWPSWAGAVVGSLIVMVYCVAGGIRASIWTDVAQSLVMIVAMGILLWVALQSFDSVELLYQKLNNIDGYLNWFPQNLVLPGLAGGLLFALSWMFAGISVIAQPHIMVRFMTLNSSGNMRQARLWYYLWYLVFYSLATAVGLLSRIYLPDVASFDAELALPTMAIELLPPVLVGLILAGIFAATMSTADSLVLSCSAAVTHDVLPKNIEHPIMIRVVTVLITGLALGLALASKQSVFSLVVMAWAALASAFAPLLICLCLGMQPSQRLSIVAVIAGLATVLLWRYLGLHNEVYEGFPGILVGLAILAITNKVTQLAVNTPAEIGAR